MALLINIGMLIVGAFQILAFIEGVHIWLGWGTWAGVGLFVVAYVFQPFGSLLTIPLVYYGARHGWDWAWWQAAIFAAPALILSLIGLAISGGVAILARRSY
ncbi:hypothetical protein [Ancylobacter oerskovii]|uniref:Uncharacterized protein n=1 Tax=Ancylobacter oerskovii TaxID=459519 RepID=A0ABW4YUL2_9HYPH|nr:hypothetical protein [Ancylobacter oerskovii]MBS7544647.1 hypothetical protein [Ancylobacter oerskovii]